MVKPLLCHDIYFQCVVKNQIQLNFSYYISAKLMKKWLPTAKHDGACILDMDI